MKRTRERPFLPASVVREAAALYGVTAGSADKTGHFVLVGIAATLCSERDCEAEGFAFNLVEHAAACALEGSAQGDHVEAATGMVHLTSRILRRVVRARGRGL